MTTNKCLECNFERELHPVVVWKNYTPSGKYLDNREYGMDSEGWHYYANMKFKFHGYCEEFKTEIQLKLF